MIEFLHNCLLALGVVTRVATYYAPPAISFAIIGLPFALCIVASLLKGRGYELNRSTDTGTQPERRQRPR